MLVKRSEVSDKNPNYYSAYRITPNCWKFVGKKRKNKRKRKNK